MYVGITRAQRSLHLSYCEKRKQGREVIPCEPSRFIAEMGKRGPALFRRQERKRRRTRPPTPSAFRRSRRCSAKRKPPCRWQSAAPRPPCRRLSARRRHRWRGRPCRPSYRPWLRRAACRRTGPPQRLGQFQCCHRLNADCGLITVAVLTLPLPSMRKRPDDDDQNDCDDDGDDQDRPRRVLLLSHAKSLMESGLKRELYRRLHAQKCRGGLPRAKRLSFAPCTRP
jgi:hypothetical protein